MKITLSYSILFLGDMFLFLEQYHGVLITAALHYISKSDTIRKSLLPFPLVQDYFRYTGLLWFSGDYNSGCPFCKECHWYYDVFCIVFANLHE